MRRLTIIGIVLFTTHLCAFADPCPTGTVTQLLAQVQSTGACTIGDLSFDFTDYGGRSSMRIRPDMVQFVPIAGTNPGFDLLTGLSVFDDPFVQAASDCPNNLCPDEDIRLDFSVSGGLGGMKTTLQDPSFLLAPIFDTTCCPEPQASFASGIASANLQFGALSAGVSTEDTQMYGQDAVLTTTFSNDPAAFLPVSSLTGGAELSVRARATAFSFVGPEAGFASVTLQGASFRFTETPEPQSVLLLATIVLLVIVQIRRRASLYE